MVVTAAAEVGDNEGQVEASVEGDGTTIAFNARYLVDVLQNVDGRPVRDRAQRPALARGLPAGRRRRVHPRRHAGPDDVLERRPGRRAREIGLLESLSLRDLRGYASLEVQFGPGTAARLGPERGRQDEPARGDRAPRLGPLAPDVDRRGAHPLGERPGPRRGRASGRTGVDRRAGRRSRSRSVRDGAGGQRKRIRVNGVARRAAAPGRACSGPSCSRPRTCSSSPARRVLRRAAIDTLAASRSPSFAAELATYGRALQQRNGLLRAIREGRPAATSCATGTRPSSSAGQRGRRGPAGDARGARRAAPPGPRRDRPRRGPADRPLRDQRPAAARRVGPRRARPATRRDGREGGLERVDARRAAPRRPRLRARGPRPGRVRLARPAADGDPRPQARRARPPDRARRPTAAPPARRRLQRARPGPARPPRPADRRAAPGVRHDDDARRPRPGAARGRRELGGRGRARRRDAGAAPPIRAARVADARSEASDDVRRARWSGSATSCRRPPATSGSRRSSGSPGRPRPGTPLVARARPGRHRARAGWSGSRRTRSSSRPTSRSWPRSCGCARTELLGAFRDGPRRLRRGTGFGSGCGAYNPADLPAASGPRSPPREPRPAAGGDRGSTQSARSADEARMAVRLQMKLGFVAEQDRLPDSPDTVVPEEPTIGSIVRSKGNLYLLVTARTGRGPAARGDPARRRHDPARVLLRRVGRHRRLPREGDQGRPTRSSATRRTGSAATRRTGRSASPPPSSAATSCTS